VNRFIEMQKSVRTPKKSIRFLILVCSLAFLLRVVVMFATSSYRLIDESDNHFGFGWEMGRVAYSLVQGQGFSSPLPLATGPTAMVGPVYPLILAGVFKAFGIYTSASAIAIRVIQCIFSSLTCLFVYLCGRDTVGERAGIVAALAWSVFPLNIFFTVNRVWETSLTGLLAVVLFWCGLALRDSISISRWSATGALLGIAALVNTSLVMLAVPFGLSALWRNRTRLVFPVTVGVLTCMAVVSPWLVRNYMQFGKVMLRSNFPLEFRVGNNILSHGQKMESLHPSNTPAINKHWQDVGEMRFMEEEREENSKFLAANFNRFIFDTGNRIVNYWTGGWIKPIDGFPNDWLVIVPTSLLTLLGLLGIRQMFQQKNAAALMYAGSLLVYPIVYCVTTSQPRFYHTITPLLVLSGAFWILNCLSRRAREYSTSNLQGAREEFVSDLATKRQ
jgi:4-amino-4-deoxy-L-arabinose transferase-like glycosyltransferase